ncbi:Uma2 family endonuclease [Spinactinospora alkalitolerans]|uniref:Uma2 family endonuclease n=1 Tax=Spinactinospora alkalitolerans TaxID=687207 RepID=A0A852U0B1_9ACTN|nr:Uma2 family endonuclease [Spinactinospora alkalitolerans]NYE49628.1 Uma2 family endonuclease [Spinactinospora alkalitolerans]
MSVMTLSETELGLPADRPLTVEDLEHTPDDGRRYELVDGRLDVSSAPAQPHTRAETRLTWLLATVAPDEFEVQSGPGVTFNAKRTHHRIPDVAVKRSEPLEVPHLTRPPLLAVEVVSPESILRDHHTKKREYANFGVQAYWLITPSLDKPDIIEFRLEDGEFIEVRQAVGSDVFETDFPFPVRIVPEWLVADGDWRAGIGGPEADGSEPRDGGEAAEDGPGGAEGDQ